MTTSTTKTTATTTRPDYWHLGWGNSKHRWRCYCCQREWGDRSPDACYNSHWIQITITNKNNNNCQWEWGPQSGGFLHQTNQQWRAITVKSNAITNNQHVWLITPVWYRIEIKEEKRNKWFILHTYSCLRLAPVLSFCASDRIIKVQS